MATTRSPMHEARRDYYAPIGALSLAPLWESLHALVPERPAPTYVPAHWAYGEVRPLFSFSDRPVQEALDLWRESRGAQA